MPAKNITYYENPRGYQHEGRDQDEDPFLNFVQQNKTEYDKPFSHDRDSFEPYYKEVTAPLPPPIPCHCPGRQNGDEEETLEVALERLKIQAAKWEETKQAHPHHAGIMTQQAEDVEDQNLQMTPYSDMQYLDMIKKFREANKETNDFYGAFERDRKYMQRTALKKQQLLSDQNCPACRLEKHTQMSELDSRDGSVQSYYMEEDEESMEMPP